MGLGPTRISPTGKRWIATNAVLLALATTAVLLRLWARRLRGKALVLNDYAIVLSLIFVAATSTVEIIAATHGGLGFNIMEVIVTTGPGTLTTLLKCLLESEVLYPIGMALMKISILHFYTTVFPGQTFRRVAYFIIALAVATAVGTILDAFLGCRPFVYNWDKTMEGTCGNIILAYMIPAAINLAIDIIVVILPFPVVWRLKMRLAKKIAVSLIFSMGIGVCVISGLRLKGIYSLDLANATGSVGDLGFWTALEPLLGIINACLPLLQPIFSITFNKNNFFWKMILPKQGPSEKQPIHPAPLQAEKSTLSGSRLFRRLYDHLYPVSEFTIPRSEDTVHIIDEDVEAHAADSWRDNFTNKVHYQGPY